MISGVVVLGVFSFLFAFLFWKEFRTDENIGSNSSMIFFFLSIGFSILFLLVSLSSIFMEYEKRYVVETSTYKTSNNKVAKFSGKELTSWDNRLVFCVSDCINYATDYVYYYNLNNVNFSIKIRLVKPKLFFEKHLLDRDNIKNVFSFSNNGYDLPISLENSVSRVDSVYFSVFVQFLLDNVSILEKEKLDDKKYLFFLTEKQAFNKLLMKEGLYLEMVRFND